MYSQLRLAQSRTVRAVSLPQRRLLATPPSGLKPPASGLPPTPPSTGASHVRPVVVTSPPPTPGSSTLAATSPAISPIQPPPVSTLPPPPPPPPLSPPPVRPRRIFRRFFIYTTLGLLTFWPVSGWLSTKYESYREFFISTFPGGEAVADYADEHDWESFGYGTMSKKAVEGWQYITGEEKKPETAREKAEIRARELQRKVASAGRQAESDTKREAGRLEAEANRAAGQVQAGASRAINTIKEKAAQAKGAISGSTNSAIDTAGSAPAVAVSLRDRALEATQDAMNRTKDLAQEAKSKFDEVSSNLPFNFSEGVEGIVREAEKALRQGEAKIEEVVERGTTPTTPATSPEIGSRGFAETQRPRELHPETVQPQKPSNEGKEIYTGPPLPLGHEPPPGYYIAPLAKSREDKGDSQDEKFRQVLPLLVPKIREFAKEEPIISQLASTIDSLAASLSAPSSSPSADANGILSKAQDDLTSLSQRLEDVKRAEREKLEQTVSEKTRLFEASLQEKDEERQKGEHGLREGWDKERQRMVDDWRHALESELETQRTGIEQRLREEVVSQGIELQRRWLRSIKTQVETERGGRLAKLDTLTTSLKQLERITLDNSSQLDDNVRLHKVWSALRAVQSKTESGDIAFDEALRVLKSTSIPFSGDASNVPSDSAISATLGQLEKSGVAQTGVKSFAALSSWFSNSVAPRIHSASLVPAPHEATILSHLASAGLSRVMFRPKPGAVEGNDVGSVLARAEWCLGEKDLDGATREVNSLKGWPGRLAADWLREARRKLEVQQALDVVATEATLNSLLLV